MYGAKKAGFLELLMNALSLPRSRGSSPVRRVRSLPRARDPRTDQSVRASAASKEIYIESARLSRWTR